jgi:hypothetical protein
MPKARSTISKKCLHLWDPLRASLASLKVLEMVLVLALTGDIPFLFHVCLGGVDRLVRGGK